VVFTGHSNKIFAIADVSVRLSIAERSNIRLVLVSGSILWRSSLSATGVYGGRNVEVSGGVRLVKLSKTVYRFYVVH
jgi:hypothetical protein